MKAIIRVILFLMAFTIEIKLKAAEVYRDPALCDRKKATECLLFSTHIGGKVSLLNAEVYLGRDTLLYRDSTEAWHLVRGVVKVAPSAGFQMNTLVGKFESEKSVYILQQLGTQVHLFVLSGKVMPLLKSPVTSSYFLTAGYANWFGSINSHGINQEGLPRPLVWKKFASQIGFENWYLIIKEKRRIKENEMASVENASGFYLEVFQALAQIQSDKQLAEENRRRAVEEESRNVRQLFRKKFEIESIDE
jgi:hypothetical protein